MLNRNINRWASQSANGIVKLIGIFLLVFSIISIVQGIYGLRVSFREGRFGFTYEPLEKEKGIRITGVVKGFPAEKAGLQPGDLVLLADGEPLGTQKEINTWGDAVAGTEIILTVRRGDQTIEMHLTRKLMPMLDRAVRVLFLLVLPTLILAYVLVGLWGVFKYPSFITNLIALVCFFFGGMISGTFITTASSPITNIFDYYQVKDIISSVCTILAPVAWLFLFIHFPQKAPIYKKHKKLTLSLILITPLVIMALNVLKPGFMEKHKMILTLINFIYISGFIILGIIIVAKGARKEKNMLKKRQYQLILFGIKYGSLAIFVGVCCLYLYWFWMENWGDYFGWLTFLIFLITQVISLILPFTFLNSFFQEKILETETALKRKLRYIAATSALFFLYLLAAFFLNSWIVSQFQITDPSFIVLVVLVLSLTFAPIHNRILRWLEEKLYPEKTRYKTSLKQLIHKMSGYIEESQILENLSRWISETMGISPIYALSIERIQLMKIPLKINSSRSVLAKVKDGSSFFWDEISSDTPDLIDEEEKKWALQKGISITVPMISRGEPVGILSIGKKKNREDFTGDDLEIFQEAAYHTAIAIQNIKLQAENLEKKRFEKELEVARNIQNQLMPHRIPTIKGMEIHGENKPCYEVGGDYFDIIPLNEHKTILVIGDVSGKGAGAAILMSNLQASLRMAISLSLSLPEILYKINNILYENSLPSQFITFFIGLWDNRSKNLEYINAGHNAPIIIESNNRIKRLLPTGIGLAIKEKQTYEYKKVQLNTDDVLIIYTDGIEEFFNHRLEAFGIERMIKTCKENKHLHPKEIIHQLFKELKDFAEGKESYHCDDLTIIAAKKTD